MYKLTKLGILLMNNSAMNKNTILRITATVKYLVKIVNNIIENNYRFWQIKLCNKRGKPITTWTGMKWKTLTDQYILSLKIKLQTNLANSKLALFITW